MASLYIVVAEDEPDIAQFYEAVLTTLGHQVWVAGDGLRLVELCRETRPDLVVTDDRMPGMTGVEAVKLFWRDGPVPVVLVSAREPEEIRQSFPVDRPPLLVFRKPVRAPQLEEALAWVQARQH